ncbi:hypothetical protein [Kluyvera cryocrescens]|uniref:hypothetical protein n=2 Tax=Enterobacteriaceae TaxID=543 RepID=UPI002DB59DCC|nr:hypothetical protein [Kluyvera cryocrescens]MEB6635543.1 hypothetical protein [Kluyvera cryocrescens]
MTWSKVLSFLLNVFLSTYLFKTLVDEKVDLKLACGIYAGYVIIYMLLSDKFSSWDKESGISKAKATASSNLALCEKYKDCMLVVHHLALDCITNDKKGKELRYQLNIIITQLSEAVFDSKKSTNVYKGDEQKESKEQKQASDLALEKVIGKAISNEKQNNNSKAN